MIRIVKGNYGYIEAKKRQTIVLVVLLLILILSVYFGAYYYFGTNQNWFTIMAALICLPTAKIAVSMIMFLKASGCSEMAHKEIERCAQELTAAYDLYMTTERENYALSHAVVAGGSVVALTEDPKCNANNGQTHIRHMMQGNGYHGYTVKIFTQIDSYTQRLEQLELIASNEDSRTQEKNAEVLHLLKQISL